jgi:hypothetical protein
VNPEAWPTPSEGASREPLPRVEDLPVAERGYDQASVKAAFDSFYRHAAQLDAALRTLEAVDSFHRQAAALRADLRTLRATGWTQQSYPGPSGYGYDARAPREGVSPAVWRVLGEIVFLIAVSVFLGVAKVEWWVIVAVMGGAFLLVAIIEWAASRDRWSAAVAAPPSGHPVVVAEPAREPADEGEPIGWAAFEQAQEPSDAMTIIGAPPDVPVAEEAPAEPAAPVEDDVDEREPVVEAGAAVDGAQAIEAEAAQPQPVSAVEPLDDGTPSQRRRWWRRRAPAPDGPEPEPASSGQEGPRHVRVLAGDEDVESPAVDPWEQGFDPGPAADESPADAAPEEETGEGETPVAAEAESPARRRFRRR